MKPEIKDDSKLFNKGMVPPVEAMKKKVSSNTQRDLDFLVELKKRLIAGEKDYAEKEYAMNMIDDWIGELVNILEPFDDKNIQP